MPKSTSQADSQRFALGYLIDSAFIALAIALGIVFVEVWLASPDLHWLGGTALQWGETAQTLAIYWLFLFVPTFAVALVIRVVTRHAWLDEYAPAVSGFLAGIGLWVLLRRYSADLGGYTLDAAVLGALAGAAFVSIALAATNRMRVRYFALQTSGAFVGALSAMRYVAVPLADDSARVELAPLTGVAWLAVMAAVLTASAVLLGRRAGAGRVTVAVLLVSMSLPAALYAVTDWRGMGAAQTMPDFLLVSADTMRADEISVYGGPVSMPALESLAERGVVFDRFHTTAPWTVPSLCSLFSGRFPLSLTPGLSDEDRQAEETSLHRLYSYWRGASGPTLVAGMRNRGYRTLAVVANPATNAHQWLWQDFDSYQLVNDAQQEASGPFTQSPLFRSALNAWRPGTIEERPFDSTRRVAHYAKTLLNHRTDKPLFLWVHFMDPHSPYDPPAGLRVSHDRWSMFPPSPAEQTAEPDWPYDMTDEEKAYARAQYRGEIAYIDEAVGEILGALEGSGRADSTYVCFFSDHGEEFWEHGRWGHGQTLFEEQLHVPFIFAGPRIGQGRLTEAVSAVDFAPTIADLLDLMENQGWHGQSFAGALREPEGGLRPRPVYAQSTQHAMYQDEPAQMVMDWPLKFVRGLESGSRGLYDLSADPGEQTNLAESRPADVERLNKMLDTWAASFPSTVQQGLGAGGTLVTDPEVLDAMKAVGYVSE